MKKRIALSVLIAALLILCGCKTSVEDQPVKLYYRSGVYTGSYTGVIVDDYPEGYGYFRCDDGWLYSGGVSSGIIIEDGVFTDFPVTVECQDQYYEGTYSGSLIDGNPAGFGEFVVADGSWNYKGLFVDGKIAEELDFDVAEISAKGEVTDQFYTLTYQGKTFEGYYSGTIADDVPTDMGEFHADNGTEYLTYSGLWGEDDLFLDGQLSTNCLPLQFNDVAVVGTYNGHVTNGEANGNGTFTADADGVPCVYEGDFRNGMMHGKGTLYYGENEIWYGIFENGMIVSKVVEYK